VFTAAAPNLVWLTDITEHATSEGKLYLCAIKDVYSNRILGYSIDSRMKASLAVAALRNAIALRTPAPGSKLCHHAAVRLRHRSRTAKSCRTPA
jgi:transposase InsO family protein